MRLLSIRKRAEHHFVARDSLRVKAEAGYGYHLT